MGSRTTSGLGTAEVIGNKRGDILRLAAKYAASRVRVFRSVARGEAGPDSDLDLLVDFRPDYQLWDKIGLKQEIEDLIGREVDVVHERFMREELAPDILKEAIPL